LGGLDLLVNNAGIAFKGNTFGVAEAETTIKTNTLGTMMVCRSFLPLLQESGADGRLVNVASMAGRLRQISPELGARFSSGDLTESGLEALMQEFTEAVHVGKHSEKGWSNSMYGVSKLGVIAYTRMLARRLSVAGPREHPSVTCCCPGYCATDMSSWRGTKTAEQGADTPAWLALMSSDEAQRCHGLMFQERQQFQW